MPWFLQTKGTPGQCNAAAAALTTNDVGTGQNAQLARAISDLVNEINSLAANQQLQVIASGDYGPTFSTINISVDVIPGVFQGQVVSPPQINQTPHYS